MTGGAGLLGKEFCSTLAAAGAQVVVADINQISALETAAALNREWPDPESTREGVRAIGVPTDVTDVESVRQLVTVTLEKFGRLDILVNSAALDPKFDPQNAGSQINSFEEFPLGMWKQALDINLTGLFLCSQMVSKPMLAQGSGVIINICSIYGMVGPDQRMYEVPGQPKQFKPVYYSVTKAGVLGITRYLATYFAGKNIRVNALTPGGVFNDHSEHFVKAYSSRAVLGRMAEKHEMNGALLFLASGASSYMTGANLVVDGGWTAW